MSIFIKYTLNFSNKDLIEPSDDLLARETTREKQVDHRYITLGPTGSNIRQQTTNLIATLVDYVRPSSPGLFIVFIWNENNENGKCRVIYLSKNPQTPFFENCMFRSSYTQFFYRHIDFSVKAFAKHKFSHDELMSESSCA